jgi:putative membrane protein
MMGPGWMIGIMGVNALIGIGLLALVIVGIVVGVRWLTTGAGQRAGGSRSNGALDVLRERYARGEISRDEFQRMRQDLS